MELEELQAAFAADPNSNAYYELIARYVELDRLVEALVVAKKAVALRPEDATALRTLGWVLLTQNKVDRALAELGKALQLEPGDYEARFLYALGLERLERYQEAEIQIDYVLAAFPDHRGAGEAKERLSQPVNETEEDREQVVEKTIMMAAADILSSRTLTGAVSPKAASELENIAQNAVDEGIEAQRQRSLKANQEQRAEVAQASAAAREQLEEVSQPEVAPTAAIPQHAPTTEIDTYRKQAFISLGLALFVAIVLGTLYTVYSSWAAQERAFQERFTQAEKAFVRNQPHQLLKALKLAEGLVEEVPDHHLAIGLAAHAAARLANEYNYPEGWSKTKTLLAQFPADQTSVSHRAASALYAAHTEKFADAMAALELEANGKKLNLALFKSIRGVVMHRQGRHDDARKSMQESVADGADNPELNWNLSRFEFETGRPGVAQAYAGRLLSAADQARDEAVEKARAEQAKAQAAQTDPKAEAVKAKTIEPLAFARIEHGPALILRAASWLVRSEPLARPALADLERAVALPLCSAEGAVNCLFEGHRLLGEALMSVAHDRLGQSDKARGAQARAGSAYDEHPWALLARSYLDADRGASNDALGLVDTAQKALPHSALPVLARFHAQKLMKPPTASTDELDELAKRFSNLRGQAMTLTSEILAKKGDKEAALKRVDAYLEAFPEQVARAKVYRAQALRWSKSYKEALTAANDALDTAIKTGAMNLGHAALIEIMRLELRRGGRGSARKAYKDLLKDNPNHAEALYLANTILSDREAGKHLSKIAPGSRWAMKLRAP